jgi:hypothetical protein
LNDELCSISSKFGGEKAEAKIFFNFQGNFDTMYDKNYIKEAGFCQSILSDVSFLLRDLGIK